MRELKSQLEELLANLGTQKEKLSQQKLEHETEVFTCLKLDMVVRLDYERSPTGTNCLHHFCQLHQLL